MIDEAAPVGSAAAWGAGFPDGPGALLRACDRRRSEHEGAPPGRGKETGAS